MRKPNKNVILFVLLTQIFFLFGCQAILQQHIISKYAEINLAAAKSKIDGEYSAYSKSKVPTDLEKDEKALMARKLIEKQYADRYKAMEDGEKEKDPETRALLYKKLAEEDYSKSFVTIAIRTTPVKNKQGRIVGQNLIKMIHTGQIIREYEDLPIIKNEQRK